MVLKKGDFVRINFTGKVKETGEVFDTTYESVAKEHGLYDPKISFRQRPVIIGARHVISGVDKALEGSEVGEKKMVVVPPEDGFGQRDPSKVRVVPLREFKKRNLNPVPGMHVEFEDSIGRVQSVSGGRVRVDLNHGLAGKVLLYEVKVEEKTNKIEEKIRQLIDLYIPNVDLQSFGITLTDRNVEIVLPDVLKVNPSAALGKFAIVRDTFAFIEGVDQVVYKEIHQKTKPPLKEEKKPKTKPKAKKPKSA